MFRNSVSVSVFLPGVFVCPTLPKSADAPAAPAAKLKVSLGAFRKSLPPEYGQESVPPIPVQLLASDDREEIRRWSCLMGKDESGSVRRAVEPVSPTDPEPVHPSCSVPQPAALLRGFCPTLRTRSPSAGGSGTSPPSSGKPRTPQPSAGERSGLTRRRAWSPTFDLLFAPQWFPEESELHRPHGGPGREDEGDRPASGRHGAGGSDQNRRTVNQSMFVIMTDLRMGSDPSLSECQQIFKVS